MKSLLRSGAALVTAAVLGGGIVLAGTALPADRDSDRGWGDRHGNNGRPVTAEQIYQDEIKDYGVCRGTDPICYNNWGNGWVEGEQKRILIWSRTAGPRHAHLGTPLAPGLNPPLNPDNIAQAGLKAWAEERGIAVDYTEDLASFGRLGQYQAVVFLSSSRDTLDDAAQTIVVAVVTGQIYPWL